MHDYAAYKNWKTSRDFKNKSYGTVFSTLLPTSVDFR